MPKYIAIGIYVSINECWDEDIKSIPINLPYKGSSRDPVQAWKEFDDRYGAIQLVPFPAGFDLDSCTVFEATWRWERLIRD